jgi:hypothetical protein
VLFDPAQHEVLEAGAWSEERAQRAIRAIVADADESFDPDGWWPIHPLDDYSSGSWRTRGLWIGAAGVLWALDALQRTGLVELSRDYAPVAMRLHEDYLAGPEIDQPTPSLWMGESGILLVAQRLAPSRECAECLFECVRANIGNEMNELMWGAPGRCLPRR